MRQLWVLAACLLAQEASAEDEPASSSSKVFANPTGLDYPFQHLVVDRKSTNRVYVGAVNRLFELQPDLSVRKVVETGPANDSPECPDAGVCEAPRSLLPAHNKALAIYEAGSQLLECSSLHQGRCRLRKLYSIDTVIGNASQAIVANDKASSTVVFVAPGPPNPASDHVLYVGSTYTDVGSYRDEVPAVASLSLEPSSLFRVAHRSINTETRMFLERSKRKNYPIDYVAGFAARNFSYFVTRQAKVATGPSPYISKLVRLCQADQEYYSYTEVPLVCSQGSVDYNLVQDAYVGKPGFDLAIKLKISTEDDVLYAVFSRGTGAPDLSTPSLESALCVYSLKEVNKVFMENIQLCNEGKAMRGLEYFKPTGQCKETNFPPGFDVSCGIEVNYPLGGNIPVRARPVLSTRSERLTAVAASAVHQYSVAFLGTHDGQLIKAVVESGESGWEYDRVEMSAARRPVLPDMDLDMSTEFLIVLTPDAVSKVRVHDCGRHSGCRACLGAADPYCGWCSLESACTAKDACAAPVDHWRPYQDTQCTAITSVLPDKIQITSAQYLRLSIDNLPRSLTQGQLSCVFTVGKRTVVTGVTKQGDGHSELECPTPPTANLPPIPPGQHDIPAQLAVQVDPKGPELAQTNLTFFDCSSYSSCTACVSSAFPCDWCAESHQCTHAAEDRCRNDHIVNGLNRAGPSNRRGPLYCPRISSAQPRIYVASGTKRAVEVQARNLLDFQSSFTCEFRVQHSLHRRPAKRSGDFLLCEPLDFVYFGPGNGNGTDTVRFSVLWAPDRPLDNPDAVSIMMYKCDRLATNCGKCLNLRDIEPQLNCGWCPNQNSCESQDKCTAPSISTIGSDDEGKSASGPRKWMTGGEMCEGPKITDFYPKSGPIDGGTLVTIEGINLGRTAKDLANAVQINNFRCDVLPEQYEVASKVVCRTSKAAVGSETGVGKPSSGPIVVKLGEDLKFVAISEENWEFVDPVITGLSPMEGIQAGGTDVRISGRDLDAGSEVRARIAGVACRVLRRSRGELVCRTTAAASLKSGGVQLQLDLSRKQFVRTQFHFRPNPVVRSVRPEKTTESGGVAVEVRGQRFRLVQRPRMYVSYAGQEHEGEACAVVSDEAMLCRTPHLGPHRLASFSRPIHADFGFRFDDLNLTSLGSASGNGFNRLQVYPDPILDTFPGKERMKYYKGEDDYLTINGQELTRAASDDDVSVRIGKGWCNLTVLAEQALSCRPPSSRPEPLNPNNHHPEVLVQIGNRQYQVGYLSYSQKSEGLLNGFSWVTVLAIVGAVLAFIIALIILLLMYQRKSNRHSRQMKTLKSQMINIELKVASECKEAFAELQTDINAVPLGAGEVGPQIPFLSYKDYASQVLFPQCAGHPALRELEVEPHRASAMEKGLRQFNQLLMNKTFLLHFIRTLESNRYFMTKDRSAVGSLLMVILQERLEYCTDVLKQLLSELIERTLERKLQPKILFRRSESVAERMLSAWFTFLMHGYMEECAGEPLFLLYWAIKRQIEKGPVDAITLEARYSLSEEKLLRQSVEFKDLTVFVSGPLGGAAPVVEAPVRVLDCDTVTQVKEKCLDELYRASAHSQRPAPAELDLEWRSGASGRLLLQDLDASTKAEPGGWKRLNTLAHYKVPPNASLHLLHRQASQYNLSLLSERSDKSSTFSLSKASPTLGRAFSPHTAALLPHHQHHQHQGSGPGFTGTTGSRGGDKDSETGYKLYHLVKPNDHSHLDNEREKLVSEIYLTRLLYTKGTLQRFMEDLLDAIFSTAHRGSSLPLAVKYMFDFFDEQAHRLGITDPDTVHAWKSNALPLRFWVNLIKNPHFVFDIPRLPKVEGCLSVAAQTLMDACSTQDHQLTKDSPSSKLLFARDIPRYREWVDAYYSDVSRLPPVSDQDMGAYLAEQSREHQHQFYVYSALAELFRFLDTHREPLMTSLSADPAASSLRLPDKLAHMLRTMDAAEPPPLYPTNPR